MKALKKLANGPGNIKIVEVSNPIPGEGQVLVKVERAGICGTDVHIFHGLFPKVRPPVTLGHEFAGVVAEVGPGVDNWCPGDRVCLESEASSCGRCKYCMSGLTNLCPERLAYGYSMDGGFALFVTVRQTALHQLPDHTTFREGALCEPLAVAVHAVMECAEISANELVLVTGPGPIGLLVLQVAKSKGARIIITGTEKDKERLDTAARLGADHVIKAGQKNLLDLIMDLSDGLGVAAAFECSGVAAAMNDCLNLIKRRGRMVQVGLFGKMVETAMDHLAMKEVTLKGAFAHNNETWKKAIALLARKMVDLKSLVSGEFAINDWEEAFRLSEGGTGIKYLLYPVD
jgi:L-iditol 2-dehydrogenase